MKHVILQLLAVVSVSAICGLTCAAMPQSVLQEYQRNCHVVLDVSDPVVFLGDRIIYGGDTIHLGPKALFVDGSLADDAAISFPFVFNSFGKAAECFADGTEDAPMRVYVAPYVYWIDCPDTPAVAVGKDGREPFGMTVRCRNLHIVGLTRDARNVVFASQRGQTQGAVGNFTMFDFYGDGLQVSNLTMGNYCNVDLEYPLKPELGRPRRSSAITQAHVAYCHGDRVVARNVRFISRLNMNPLNGARRILFDGCHMECTDDALTGNGVYLNCTISLYGQKPFYTTHSCGAVFLNCDFRVMGGNRNMVFCKSSGPVTLIDCRYHAADSTYVGWANYPAGWLRCYQAGFSLNGNAYRIGGEKPQNTVEIDNSEVLKAFRLPVGKDVPAASPKCSACVGDSMVYNIYNLLRGDDFLDFCGQRTLMESLGASKPCATFLKMNRRKVSIQTGGDAVWLCAEPRMHGDYAIDEAYRPEVHWRVASGGHGYVTLEAAGGDSVKVVPCNITDETVHLCIEAYTDDGLQGAVEVDVLPSWLPAPAFLDKPSLRVSGDTVTVDYLLDTHRADCSLITWYRCRDANGAGAIPVAVSRGSVPERVYRLTVADAGWHIMAVVESRHNRCMPGKGERAVTRDKVMSYCRKSTDSSCSTVAPSSVTDGGIAAVEGGIYVCDADSCMVVETDFRTFPTSNQPMVLPGFWTVDGYKPADTDEFQWTFDMTKDMWTYGEGYNGAVDFGLLQAQRGARLLYTPVKGCYGDMEVKLSVDPTKTAGQGFGSATGQYMDVYIKFDTHTLTGYALRIIRTVKHAKAVDFLLVRYDNGAVTSITEPVTSVCYRTGCNIVLRAEGCRLTARVDTTTPLAADSGLAHEVNLEADIVDNSYGGSGVQHTGTCGESTTMLHRMEIRMMKKK